MTEFGRTADEPQLKYKSTYCIVYVLWSHSRMKIVYTVLCSRNRRQVYVGRMARSPVEKYEEYQRRADR